MHGTQEPGGFGFKGSLPKGFSLRLGGQCPLQMAGCDHSCSVRRAVTHASCTPTCHLSERVASAIGLGSRAVSRYFGQHPSRGNTSHADILDSWEMTPAASVLTAQVPPLAPGTVTVQQQPEPFGLGAVREDVRGRQPASRPSHGAVTLLLPPPQRRLCLLLVPVS